MVKINILFTIYIVFLFWSAMSESNGYINPTGLMDIKMSKDLEAYVSF